MKDCIYYLNIGNRNVVLIGDEELNKFISENIVSNRKLSIEEELTPNRVFGVFKNNEETLVINNNLPGGKIQEGEDPREFLEKKFNNFENLQISDILASNLINDEKFANHNPQTMVFKLVEELLGKSKKLNKELVDKFG